MRHLRHLVAADMRRFRVLLCVWLIVVSMTAIVTGLRPVLMASPETQEMASILGDLVWLAELLLACVVAVLVVQAHPAIGSDAFWMTRRPSGDAVHGRAMDPVEPLSLWRSLPFTLQSDRLSGFRARALLITFWPGKEETSFVLDRDWLEGAELVVVRTTPEGTVRRTLHIADFPLRPGDQTPASFLSGN